MTPRAESRITKRSQYLRVEFGGCDALELSAIYQSFVDLCLGTQVNRALLQAGDNEPDGHRQLRDVLLSVARTAATSRSSLKVAASLESTRASALS